MAFCVVWFLLPAAEMAADEFDWSTLPSSPSLLMRTGELSLLAPYWCEVASDVAAPSTPSGWRPTATPWRAAAQAAVGSSRRAAGKRMVETVAVDRLAALRRPSVPCGAAARSRSAGSTGAMADPMPMMEMFDKGLTLRMGQCNVQRWIDDICPCVEDRATRWA